MPRRSWPKKEALAIRDRVHRIIAERFGGVQARFIEECEVPRDTASKWFRKSSPRTPDTRTLARVARACEVSLDWLVLDRGTMCWPVAVSGKTAKVRLADAVYKELKRRRQKDKLRALAGLGNVPEALWRLVIKEVADFPSLHDLVEDMGGDRDEG